MTKILITGANGFLGKRIVHAMRQHEDVQLRLCGRKAAHEDPSSDYVCCDICDQHLPAELFDDVSIAIHAAGLAHCFDRNARPDYESTNVEGTVRLAEAAKAAGVKHFIFISSVAVYGPSGSRNSAIRDESVELNPVTEYGKSKEKAERLLIEKLAGSETLLTILRPATIYGAREPGNIRRLIRFLSRMPFWVTIGSGINQKSLIHVDDAAELICSASLKRSDVKRYQVFNVSDTPRPMKQITDQVCEVVGTFLLPLSLPTAPLKIVGSVRLKNLLEKWEFDDAYDGTRLVEHTQQQEFRTLSTGLTQQYQDLRRRGELQKGAAIKRCFDVVSSLVLLAIFTIPMLIIGALVKLTSSGPALYSSSRAGANGELFPMLKFRSMKADAPQVATHLLTDSKSLITPIGRILRKTSLDELPQLLNVLFGHMSLVGPRPALFNQSDLISLRTCRGISWLRPGITGWAQICGRDEISIPEKVELDVEYADRRGFWFDFRILWSTGIKVIARDNIAQADSDTRLNAVTVRHGEDYLLMLHSDFATVGGLFADEFARSDLGIESNKSLKVVTIRDWAEVTPQDFAQQTNSLKTVIAARECDMEPLLQLAVAGSSILKLPIENPKDDSKQQRLATLLFNEALKLRF